MVFESPVSERTSLFPHDQWLAVALAVGAVVWVFVVAVMGVRLFVGAWGLHRLRRYGTEPLPGGVHRAAARLRARLGLSPRVEVLATQTAAQPIAFGLLRPIVLLPVSLLTKCPIELVEAMLAHELAHIPKRSWKNSHGLAEQ